MHTRTGLQFIVLAAATLCLWSAGSSRASACKCRPSTVESSYNTKSDVFIATIDLEITAGDTRYYVGQVDTTYKGCLIAGDLVLLKTPVESATCGAQLTGLTHLINANLDGTLLGVSVLSIDSCSYNVEADALTDHDREFLDGRYVCCGEDCACADGSQPVQCFVDPCQVAPGCSVGECRSNYCGGCNAEFFDPDGYAVCQLGGPCDADEDCGDAAWCRQAADDDYGDEDGDEDDYADDYVDEAEPEAELEAEPRFECVPFVGEGESCNGYTLPSSYEQCEPGLVCDTPDYIADATGICGRGCSASSDCWDGEYCATDGVCALHGSCELHLDCNIGDNVYAKPRCLGFGVCDDDGQCGYRCGNPQCADLAGYDFGPCDAVLGWAIAFGRCVQVSGCSSDYFELFATEAECQDGC